MTRVRPAVTVLFLVLLGGGLTARADLIGHGGMVRDVAVSPAGDRVLTAGFDYVARLWDFADQRQLGVLSAHAAPVDAVAFLSSGRALTAGDDGLLVLWDLTTGTPVKTFRGHAMKVAAVAVAPSQDVVATASWDRTVRLWSVGESRELVRLDHPADVDAVAFGADGRTLFTGGKDGIIRLWDTENGRPLGELSGHGMAVTDLAVAANGSRLLSAGIDGSVRLWDLSAAATATAPAATDRSQTGEVAVLEGHDGPVLGVAFAAAGDATASQGEDRRQPALAASAGRDGAVIIWQLESQRPLRIIAAHDGPVWAVAWTPDGQFVLSAGTDGSVRVWHAQTGERVGTPAETRAQAEPWLTSDHPGARLYRACAGCHALTPAGLQRSGPHFAGLFGRRAGSVSGYAYSPVLRRAGFVWDEESLRALFAKGPHVFVPGSKMPLQRIPDPEDLEALLDYMKTITTEQRP